MTQQPLNFGRLYTVDDRYSDSMTAMKEAVAQISPLVAAGACGVEATDLIKMLTPGSARHFRFRAAFSIGALDGVSTEIRARILTPFNECLGFGPPEPAKRLTPEQELAKYRETVARMAPAIAQLADKEIGR